MEAWLTQSFRTVGNQVIVYTHGLGFIGFDPTDPTGLFTSSAIFVHLVSKNMICVDKQQTA